MTSYLPYLACLALVLGTLATALSLQFGHLGRSTVAPICGAWFGAFGFGLGIEYLGSWLAGIVTAVAIGTAGSWALDSLVSHLDNDLRFLATLGALTLLNEVARGSPFLGLDGGLHWAGVLPSSDVNTSTIVAVSLGLIATLVIRHVLFSGVTPKVLQLHWVRDSPSTAVAAGISDRSLTRRVTIVSGLVGALGGVGLSALNAGVSINTVSLHLLVTVLTIGALAGFRSDPLNNFTAAVFIVVASETLELTVALFSRSEEQTVLSANLQSLVLALALFWLISRPQQADVGQFPRFTLGVGGRER